MTDWIPSRKQKWFTNARWMKYAFEAARKKSAVWNSYYGQYGYTIKPFVDYTNPNYKSSIYRGPGGGGCTICEKILSCGIESAMREACVYAGRTCRCENCEFACFYCLGPDCGVEDPDSGWCESTSDFNPCQTPPNQDPIFTCECMPEITGESCLCVASCDQRPCTDDCPCDEEDDSLRCIDNRGNVVACDSADALCNPCDGSCDDMCACPCGPEGECRIVPCDGPCPELCCPPGSTEEDGCCNCDGELRPCDLCGGGDSCDDPNTCCPYGQPLPEEYCRSCEVCNVPGIDFEDYPQCLEENGECCKCQDWNTGAYVECEFYDEQCVPPTCAEFSANCYECGSRYIPIWFTCPENIGGSIINPPGGPETVCYEYNTNDPIYYNPGLNQGAAVVVEHDNPKGGGSYSYGQVATLCAIPDHLQLCVYLVTSGGETLKLTYQDDFVINTETATITLDSSVNTNGYVKVRFARCTDDSKMFLTFTEGAKLSADDVNASLHQLLFLIQEKEFAANNYYQLENAIGLGGAVQFDFDSTNHTKAVATDGLIVTGNPTNGQTVKLEDGQGEIFTYTADSSLSAGTASAASFSSVGTNDQVADALIAAINNIGNFLAAEGTATNKVTITQDQYGATGNTNIVNTLTNVSTNSFSGAVDFIDSDLDGYYFTLISFDGGTNFTTRKYRYDFAGTIDTGEYINGDEICIQIENADSWNLVNEQIEAAISSSNGHGTKLTTKRFTTDTLNDSLQITQATVGAEGNTAISYSSELNTIMNTTLWQFVNGAAYDTSKPVITFDPPISLPINFSIAGMTADSVLTWDGDGSFVGRTPDHIVNQTTLDQMKNVKFSTVLDKNILMWDYDSQRWRNKDFATEVLSVVDTINLNDWISYNIAADGKLDDYYLTDFDTAVDTAWTGVSGVAGIPKQHIPNSITSFGMGYYAAEKQITDQIANSSSALNAKIVSSINSSGASSGKITSSFRWELSKGEGRDIANLLKRPYYDVRDFDSLDFTNPDAAHTGRAYYLYDGGSSSLCTACRNKLFKTNIDSFTYSGSKSTTFGLGPHKENSGTPQGEPVTDRYLERIRSVLTMADWGAELGYTEQHPLRNYPTDNTGTGGTYGELLDYQQTDNYIRGQYEYTTLDKTLQEGSGDDTYVYNSTKNLPSVVTYSLGQLWDNSTGTLPAQIVWAGSLDQAGDLANWTDYGFDGGTNHQDAPAYLGAVGNYYFYYRWWFTGHDSDGSGSDLASFDTIQYYSPFVPEKLQLDGTSTAADQDEYTILPFKQGTEPTDADQNVAQRAGYSFLVEANKAFSNLERVMPDMYDEYVFTVTLGADARTISTDDCPDANCYEVQAKIERYIDGCVDGETKCTQMGSGSSNSAGSGYHIYPDEFEDNVLRAWDTYPFEKLGIEIRNKTGSSFDVVLKCPRLKRIGLIDIFTDTSNASDETEYHQLALNFLTNYTANDFDEGDEADDPASSTPTNDIVLGDMKPENVSAFTIETAVQFIRLGIPTCIRIAINTVSTPQTKVFTG